MSSIFQRSPAPGSRPPGPPSAFKTTVGSRSLQPGEQKHRISRNFEDALRTDQTTLITSGLDENKLGYFTPPTTRISPRTGNDTDGNDSFSASPSMSRSRQATSATINIQPATPKIVPPTPIANSPVDGVAVPSDEDSATNKRRSLLRSPGTASSPDLATLVRKARERGGVIGATPKTPEPARRAIPQVTINEPTAGPSSYSRPPNALSSSSSNFLSPSSSGSRLRATSSTSSFSIISPIEKSHPNALKSQTLSARKIVKPSPPLPMSPSSSSDFFSRSSISSSGKDSSKSSMRSKTGAFFTKFIGGQGSVRDKRRANSLTGGNGGPTASRPPIPPLPTSTPTSRPSSQQKDLRPPTASSSNTVGKALTPSKPSLSIQTSRPPTRDSNDQKPIFEPNYSPVAPPRPRAVESLANAATKAGRRRSMSVGDVDISKLASYGDTNDSPPRKSGESSKAPLSDWDLAMKEVIGGDDFSGAFKGLTTATPPRKERPHSRERLRQSLSPLAPTTSKLREPETMSLASSSATSTENETRTPSRRDSTPIQGIETLRLVSKPESVPLPDTPDATAQYRVPSPVLTSSSEDVFLTPESTPSAGPYNAVFPDMKPMTPTTPTSTAFPSTSRAPEPKTPGEPQSMLSPRSSSLRLPQRSPNPFSHHAHPSSASSPTPNTRVNTLRASSQRSSISRPSTANTITSSSLSSPSASRPSLEARRSREFRPSRVQPRAAASASEPALLSSEKPVVSEDGFLSLAVRDPRTVRLVPSAYSMPMSGDRVSSASYSAYSNGSSTTDLTSSRYPSSTKVALEPEELESRARELSAKCWADDESFLAVEKIAEWLGGVDPLKKQTLKYYMDYFDFTGLRLDNAFRHLCGKLYLRGETQQVDRILEAFSARFWECNPSPIYHSADVVHAISYSLLLLNTDLHVADISTRMSKNQFVRNTFAVVQPQFKNADVGGTIPLGSQESDQADAEDVEAAPRESIEPSVLSSILHHHPHHKKRSGSLTSWTSQSNNASQSMVHLAAPPADSPEASRVSINLPSGGYHDSPRRGSRDTPAPFIGGKSWENDIELLLKDMYTSIKNQQILQPIVSSERNSSSSLAPGSPMLRARSQRGPTDRMKRGSIRGIQTLLGAQSPYSNSSSSIDGRVSPSPSFATSIGDGISTASSTFFQPTLGFASNLSHSIIKEAQEDDNRSLGSVESATTSVSISDEELALLGAPWAKEGMLSRKQYWETAKRRAKSKAWMDVFVVISKGELSMFTFGDGGASAGGSGVGGGNWLSNANLVGEFPLSHSLAHALPPPGYNRQRPHCFVLTLSSGAVYFFQAGTEDLVNEWVSTCNYWAARQSREPLSGGVSNMEYGWSRLLQAEEDSDPPERDRSDSFSIRSGRSSKLAKRSWADVPGSVRSVHHSVPADRAYIHDWKPPMPPAVASSHDEETQLDSLQKQVNLLKAELQQHNELRQPMQELYTPRSANLAKAMSNWEQKSQYLLAEIIKYDSYVESLRHAMALRLDKRGQKVLEKALVEAPEDDDGYPVGRAGSSLGRVVSRGKTIQTEETIQEAEEPLTPGPLSGFGSIHRRETAEGGP